MSQDIFFSIGCAGSKAGSRDRAIEQAMRVLDSVEVGSLTALDLWLTDTGLMCDLTVTRWM